MAIVTRDAVGLVFAAGASVLLAGFAFVAVRAREREGTGAGAEGLVRFQRGLLVALTLVAATFLGAGTVRLAWGTDPLPVQVVEVTAKQWAWHLSEDTVIAGSPVLFRVTSTDVTHGFGIYDPAGRLLRQVQVMPDRTSELVVEFDHPGEYTLRCLELCGLLHHAMQRPIAAMAPADDPSPAP